MISTINRLLGLRSYDKYSIPKVMLSIRATIEQFSWFTPECFSDIYILDNLMGFIPNSSILKVTLFLGQDTLFALLE